jgi:hypothetical protein
LTAHLLCIRRRVGQLLFLICVLGTPIAALAQGIDRARIASRTGGGEQEAGTALVSAEGQECVISVAGKPPADLNMETWKPCPIPWIISERQVMPNETVAKFSGLRPQSDLAGAASAQTRRELDSAAILKPSFVGHWQSQFILQHDDCGQTLNCRTTNGSLIRQGAGNVTPAPNRPDKNEFRVLPAYHSKPNRFLAAIKRHPKVTIGLSLAGGATAGGIYSWVSRQHCDHYEYGQVGVGVNCPKGER